MIFSRKNGTVTLTSPSVEECTDGSFTEGLLSTRDLVTSVVSLPCRFITPFVYVSEGYRRGSVVLIYKKATHHQFGERN